MKELAPQLLTAPHADQRELLLGWLRGDGGLEVATRGRVKLLGTSASESLARQMFQIGMRIGLRPSFKARAHRFFDVYFATEDAVRLGYILQPKRLCSTRRVINGHVLARVRRVERYRYVGLVCDITVDGDNLFAAPFALVHNCDPPYLHSTRTAQKAYGTFEMDEAQHRELLDVLRQCKGKVMLSGYPSKLYDDALADWTRHTFDLPNQASGAKVKGRETEVLWCNF